MIYREPELTYLVLDYKKETETRLCLESIKQYTKFEHKVIYLHNGADADYPHFLFKEGLIDQFIQTKENTGLGIGTRDLFAASFSPYSCYLQNDQALRREFSYGEFRDLLEILGKQYLNPDDGTPWTAVSVDLAGGVWGWNRYTERAHIMPTNFYKEMEARLDLGYHGAGPYHDGEWREARIQSFYKLNKYLQYTADKPLVYDLGQRSVRQNADGSVWEHKVPGWELRLVSGPVRERALYPPLSEREWGSVLSTQSWPEWQIPEGEKNTV